MITNNPEIKKAPFYSEDKILAVDTVDKIDPDFVLRDPINVDYHFKENLLPSKLLQYIDQKL